MVYSDTPQPNFTIASTTVPIRNNFLHLRNSIGTEHRFDTANPNNTYHLKASMPNLGTAPSLPAGTNGMYYVAGANARFFDGTTISRLTEGTPGASGFQWFGKVLVQWGFVSNTSNGTGTTNFPTAFPTACFMVVPNSTYGSTAPSARGIVAIQKTGSFPSVSKFNWYFDRGSSTQYTGFYWIAIGN